MPKLSIVMPVYNKSELTQQAILNIVNVCKYIDYELLVIDDWSTDDTEEIVSSLNSITNWKLDYYQFKQNVWVTIAWNQWVKYSEWEYICVINNDVIFPDWFFEKLMSWLEDWIWFVNPRFTEWDEKQPSPVMYFKNMLCGCCFMFKQENRSKLFPIDERLKLFGNDNWLHFRNREVWLKQKVKHDAICHHLKSQTTFFIPNTDMDMYYKICSERWWVIEPVYPLPEDELIKDFIFS